LSFNLITLFLYFSTNLCFLPIIQLFFMTSSIR
jgi:hypothetical protein